MVDGKKGNEKFMRGANLGLVDALVALSTTAGPNRPNPPGFKCSLHSCVSFFNSFILSPAQRQHPPHSVLRNDRHTIIPSLLTMIDFENLRTASLYINNQLLSRGLLRDGRSIDFDHPASDDGHDLPNTMGRIMGVVNDLILRRDVLHILFLPFG